MNFLENVLKLCRYVFKNSFQSNIKTQESILIKTRIVVPYFFKWALHQSPKLVRLYMNYKEITNVGYDLVANLKNLMFTSKITLALIFRLKIVLHRKQSFHNHNYPTITTTATTTSNLTTEIDACNL